MAQSIIGALRVNLGLDTAEYRNGFKNAARDTKRGTSQIVGAIRGVAVAAAGALGAVGIGAMVKQSLSAIDAQAKLARSLGTTTKSVQVLERAGDLAGVSIGEIQQATLQLTRRLSQAAAGTGPAVEALDKIGISAAELQKLPLDERVVKIQEALADFVPEAERAAVASQLFGDRAGLIFSRIDADAIGTARAELEAFGAVVSDQDAAQIEKTNDALSRLGLIGRGVGNQIAIALAPSLQALADAMGAVFARTGPVGQAIQLLVGNLGRLASTAAVFAGFLATRWVAALVAARVATFSLSGALLFLRGALIRTGIGAIVVLAGELVFQLTRLARATGGFGEALGLLKDVAVEAWDRIAAGLDALDKRFQASALDLRAAFLTAFDGAIAGAFNFGDRAVAVFRGAFDAIKAIWGALPTAIGDFAFQAANGLIAGVEAMLNGVTRRINTFIEGVNTALSYLPDWATGEGGVRIGRIDDLTLGRVDNPFAGAARDVGAEAARAFSDALSQIYVEAPDTGLSGMADEARGMADGLRAAAATLEAMAGAPLESVQRIRDALAAIETDTGDTGAAMRELTEALAAADADAEKLGGSMGKVSDAAREVGEAGKSAGETLKGALDGAISSAVDLFDKFVSGAKVGFSDIMDVVRELANELFRLPFLNAAKKGLSDLFAGFFADGGFIPPGQFGIAGEAGAELISGGRHGVTVTPMEAGRGGGSVVNQVFNVTAADPNAYRYSQRQLMRRARQGLGVA